MVNVQVSQAETLRNVEANAALIRLLQPYGLYRLVQFFRYGADNPYLLRKTHLAESVILPSDFHCALLRRELLKLLAF